MFLFQIQVKGCLVHQSYVANGRAGGQILLTICMYVSNYPPYKSKIIKRHTLVGNGMKKAICHLK